LGGEIRLTSEPGQGSTFTLYLPQNYVPIKTLKRLESGATPTGPGIVAVAKDAAHLQNEVEAAGTSASEINDDADDIQPGDRVLLIIENDLSFARFLLEMARESGFKGLVSTRGSDALSLVRERKPNAITLDINLHDIDGWRILARLKDDLATRHLPVFIITTEEEGERGLRMGAAGSLTKPIKSKEGLKEVFVRLQGLLSPRTQHVLLVAKNPERSDLLAAQIEGEDIRIVRASAGSEALGLLRDNHFELAVIELDLPDTTGFDLLEEMRKDPHLGDLPAILHVPRKLTKKEEASVKRLGQNMNMREVRSLERLMDEAALFLHTEIARLPESRREGIQRLHQTEQVLRGRKILIVDDDIRNIFAMTSLLERYEMEILSAETGRAALENLQKTQDIDVVLMDIMMPDMDGYDTMRAIRKFTRFKSLPVIALTAKAMKGDREKCIDAGASDYIAKPVDSVELLSMLRFWLCR
jgi:CheY-like chemotaxis protein